MTLADEIRALAVEYEDDHGDGWNTALAEEHESAPVAAAYEAAAQKIERMLDGAGTHPTANAMRAVYADIAATIRAMTDADARAALDRMMAEARKEGMREAAVMLMPAANARGGLWAKRLESRRLAILAAAEKGTGK